MPRFDVQWGKGVEVLPLLKPGEVDQRLNPRENHPPLHAVMLFDPNTVVNNRVNRHVTLRAVVVLGGLVAVGPRDGEVGGRFYCRVLEWPHGLDAPPIPGATGPQPRRVMPYPHHFRSPCQRSSTQTLKIDYAGHYTIMMVGNGEGLAKGRVIAHLSVEPIEG